MEDIYNSDKLSSWRKIISEERYTVSDLDSSFVLTSWAQGENATKNSKEEGREL